MKKHKKLCPKERDCIALLKSKGYSVREISRNLKRSPSTISSEIKKNGGLDCEYVAIYAQYAAEDRKENSYKRPLLKNRLVRKYVLYKLGMGWSPEQISGRLRVDYPNDKSMRIHWETIYKFIYAKEYKHLALWEYLPRKRKKRRKKNGRKVHRSKIPHRVSIHKRPEEINDKSEFGHWEGDTVEGKGHGESLHTELERVSRLLSAKKVKAITSAEALRAQIEIFQPLSPKARQSTTLDNGRENHKHAELKTLGMKTYFCDPYSSWQKGSNEYHNGLLRRYFPKGTDFSTVPAEELNDVLDELNNRPRKVLQYKTPKEVFAQKLDGVRITNRM